MERKCTNHDGKCVSRLSARLANTAFTLIDSMISILVQFHFRFGYKLVEILLLRRNYISTAKN